MHRKHQTATLIALMSLVLMTPGWATFARAENWRQVGYFRSDTRNISVGQGEVRVVLLPDLTRLNLTGNYDQDSAIVARVYPGYDLKSDLAVHYTSGPEGYRQASYEWGLGLERLALESDTVATHLGVFDHEGKRRVTIPTPLKPILKDTARLVAALNWDWDGDGTEEWFVIASGQPDTSRRAAIQSIRLFDQRDGFWHQIRTFDIRESVRTGPLELRDVTGDGEPDFVYRYFHETTGHYWVDVRIISRHPGMPNVFLPAVFDPGVAMGPAAPR